MIPDTLMLYCVVLVMQIVKLRVRVRVKVKSQKSKLDPEVGVVMG